jgi:hypothetical protein
MGRIVSVLGDFVAVAILFAIAGFGGEAIAWVASWL